MGLEELLGQLAGRQNGRDKLNERNGKTIPPEGVIELCKRYANQMSEKEPEAPILGHMYRTYNGSIVMVVQKDSDGDFTTAIMEPAPGAILKLGEAYSVNQYGFPTDYRLNLLSLSLRDDLGKPSKAVQ
jgi:hypothetical protein